MVPTGIPAYTTPLKLDKALSIPGWMHAQELLWLAEQATQHSRIVEIGSYLGRSTRALADNTPGYVIAIDDWHGPRDVHGYEPEPMNGFRNNMAGLDHKCIALSCPHENVLPKGALRNHIHCEFADMIFVDGSHEYEDVKRDIAKWLPYLEKGGLMCGHDFAEAYEGVRRAVCEAFAGKQIAVTDTIWAVIP